MPGREATQVYKATTLPTESQHPARHQLAGRVLPPRADAFGIRLDTLILVQIPTFSELE